MDVDEFDLRYSLKSESSSLDFGGNYRKTRVQVVGVTTQQDLGTWGVGNPRDVDTFAPGVMEAFCMACRFDGYPVGNAQVAFRGDAADLFGPLSAAYPGNTLSINANANQVDEDILAFYAQFGLQSELLGRNVSITGGLRYEQTEVEALAAQAVPSQIRWTADNDFVIDNSPTAAAVSGSGRYNHLLPNIDIKMDVTDNLVARMSYSQTIGRVPYGNLFASTAAGAPNNPTVARRPDGRQLAGSKPAAARVAELRRVGRVVLR